MNKLYLVIVDLYNTEENSIVNICTSREQAEKQIETFRKNFIEHPYYNGDFNYHIDEIEIDYNKDILWDCYKNSIFK